MKRLMVGIGVVVAFLLSTNSRAQSGAVTPAADAGHPSQASCVILKRMGRIGRTESRLYHFGISGKQFRYVEGNLPEGFSRHGKMTDHDVRNLQSRGAQVLVLDSNYTPEDLKEARADCQRGIGKTSDQVEAKTSPAPARAPTASAPGPAPNSRGASAPVPEKALPATTPAPKVHDSAPHDSSSSTGTDIGTDAALLDVSSTPAEAEVYVDDHLSGRTPSTLILMPGDHKITIKKNGFVVWKRKLKLPSGRNNLEAALLPKSK